MRRRNYKCGVSINQTLQYEKTLKKINEENIALFKEIHDTLVDMVSTCEKIRNQIIEDVKKGQPVDSEELLVDAKSHLNAAISEKNIIGELIGLRKIVRELSKDEGGIL